MDQQNKSIGALWGKTGKSGQWFSGIVEINGVKKSIVIFANRNKIEDRHPDWVILESKPKEAVKTS